MHNENDKISLERKAKQLLIGGLVTFGLSTLLIVFLPLAVTKLSWFSIGVNAPNEIGDTLGGIMGPIVALLGVGLTFLAFWAQYVANQEQRQQFLTSLQKQEDDKKEQQFESQFFEMLRLHKANVDEMEIVPLGIFDDNPVVKRRVFEVMADEFKELLGLCVFGKKMTDDIFKNAYDIFFWGFSNEQFEKLSSAAKAFFANDGMENYKSTKPFHHHQGYSGLLGHYFRHLFMMVKFVVNSKVIVDYNDKMKYLKILRAQLSNHEQIMLFYNWLAKGYGDAWEDDDNRFFTDYKMIHNLWGNELFQNQYIIDAVNGLIDKYNKKPKQTPLFEFQVEDFYFKLPDIEDRPLADAFN